MTKGHWGLAKDKANIHTGIEKVQTYEEAFAKVQEATGISDIDQLVKLFIENEDRVSTTGGESEGKEKERKQERGEGSGRGRSGKRKV